MAEPKRLLRHVGNLRWTLKDKRWPRGRREDGHLLGWPHDTVRALRDRWRAPSAHDATRPGGRAERQSRLPEGARLPAAGRSVPGPTRLADQLGGVVCQVVASKVLMEMKAAGALRGVIIESVASVAEEDNDGGGPMYIARHEFPGAPPARLPDVVILTEGTGCAKLGACGLYRGQRGRMQIEVEVVGKSCHGSMPWEGRNPLEFGARILAEAADHYDAGEGFAKDEFLGPGTRTASMATLDTPSDCAVPERFTFRFDRRLTAGEDPEQARADVEAPPRPGRAPASPSMCAVHADTTRTGHARQPADLPGLADAGGSPAITAATATYCRSSRAGHGHRHRRCAGAPRGPLIFSTDGVGFGPPRRRVGPGAPTKKWVHLGPFHHRHVRHRPRHEQNTHKIGECMDSREMSACIAFLAGYPAVLRGGWCSGWGVPRTVVEW